MIRHLIVRAVIGVALLCTAMPLEAQTIASAVAEPVAITRPPGEIRGTLLVPRASVAVPVVLLVAGSSPTDCDGNGPGFTPATLRQLAESLATRGIASLRFDKRGVGGSASAATSESSLTFDMMASDVAEWTRSLQRDRRFSRVVVAGHSEGALLGLVALRQAPAAGYVSLEGPARPADEILRDQLGPKLPAPLMGQADTILARLKRGETVETIPRGFEALFRPSVQPYLISWFRYSARDEIAHMSIPCLIVQGTRDLQVAPTEADLLHQANPRCRLVIIPDMNHVLKQTTATDITGQLSTYRAPDAPLAPGVVDAVARFVMTGTHDSGGR